MKFATAFPGFRLRTTRWGKFFLLAVLVLAMAAVNTSNNALMMLLGMALASFVVSGVWSRGVLRQVVVRVIRPPHEVFAGQPARFTLELENRSRLFPAYGLVLGDRTGRALLVLPDLPREGKRQRLVEQSFPDRGWNQVGPLRLDVELPLGFFVKSKMVLAEEHVLVYPRLLKYSDAAAERGGGLRHAERFLGRGRQGEVTQLRVFQAGDERRQIHWKQTARQGRLIVMDRQAQAEAPTFLVVDPRLSDPGDPVLCERFEHLLRSAATSAVQRLARGEAVGLVLGAIRVPPVEGSGQAGKLLTPLAEVQPQGLDQPAPALPARAAEHGRRLKVPA